MSLALELRSLTDGGRSTGSVTVGREAAALRAGHAGPHEFRVRAGHEVSVIPFRVLVPGSAWWTKVGDGAFLGLGLLVVGGVLANRISRPLVGAAGAAAAGTRYTVTVLPTDPVEVRVTSGKAETVTLAATMPTMGHALPPVGTVQGGPGRFVATDDMFVMDGVWELSISLSGARGDEVIIVSLLV